MYLTPAETQAIETRISRFEERTGAQVVTAIVGQSDTYPEIVWKAFTLAASLAALAVVALDVLRPDWVSTHVALSNVLPILGVGVLSAALALALRPYAHLYLQTARARVEVRQFARSVFLTRGLSATKTRQGILLFVSRFERRIEIVADVGFEGRVGAEDWHDVVGAMAPHMRNDKPAEAMLQGLDRAEALLTARGFKGDGRTANELPDRPLELKGPQ